MTTLDRQARELAQRAKDCADAKDEDGDPEQAAFARWAAEKLEQAAALLSKAGL